MINMSSSTIYCAYASYYSYVFAPLCLLIFGLALVFYTSSCGLPLYVVLCAFLSFLRLCQPALIWTRLSYTHTLAFMFYRTIKNITFFMIFMCLPRFLFRLKRILWALCGFYAESLPLNFIWEGRKHKETLFCNLIYCLLFNFNRTNATFRQFAKQNLTNTFIKIFKAQNKYLTHNHRICKMKINKTISRDFVLHPFKYNGIVRTCCQVENWIHSFACI